MGRGMIWSKLRRMLAKELGMKKYSAAILDTAGPKPVDPREARGFGRPWPNERFMFRKISSLIRRAVRNWTATCVFCAWETRGDIKF